MKITEVLRGAMRRFAGVSLDAGNAEGKRRTVALPSILNNYGPRADSFPQTDANQLAAFFGNPGCTQGDQYH